MDIQEPLLAYPSPCQTPNSRQNLLIILPEELDQRVGHNNNNNNVNNRGNLHLPHLSVRSPRVPAALKEKLIFGMTDSTELEDQYQTPNGDQYIETPAGDNTCIGQDFWAGGAGLTPKRRLGSQTAGNSSGPAAGRYNYVCEIPKNRFTPENECWREAITQPINIPSRSAMPRIRPLDSGFRTDAEPTVGSIFKLGAQAEGNWNIADERLRTSSREAEEQPPRVGLLRFAGKFTIHDRNCCNGNTATGNESGGGWDQINSSICESCRANARTSSSTFNNSFVMDNNSSLEHHIAESRNTGTPRLNSFVNIDVPDDLDMESVSHSWGAAKRKSLPRARTAPAMAAIGEFKHRHEKPKNMNSGLIKQALLGILLYLSLGAGIYFWKQKDFSGDTTHPIVDAVYFCVVTMCTIGYGDIAADSATTKLFASMFILVGFGFIDILLTGMVTYFLDQQENLLMSAVEGSPRNYRAKNYFVDVKKGRMRIRMKVGLAMAVVIACIGIGTAIMHTVEDLGWVDSFYLSVMSVTTVGYGDVAFKTVTGRLFACVWLLVSSVAVARAFWYLAELRIDRRHRVIAKWVLQRDMTVEDLVAADIDNNGSVSKSEYVIYKLKEMRKVEEKDILEICTQFNRLDKDNFGKITLSDLLSGH